MAAVAPGGGVISLLPGLRVEPGDVTEVELVRVRVPLVRAHRSAQGTEAVRDLVLVRVSLADGTEGWGECSALARPTYTAEHTAGAWLVLRKELAPALLAGRASGVVGHPMAKAAVEAAVTDALLRRAGRSLVDAVSSGQPHAATVASTAVIGCGATADEVVAEVAAAVADGAALVKCKVTPAATDLAAVIEVRRTWPDVALAVDWNQSATDASLAALAELGLAYAEQPGPAGDPVRGARLAERAGAPVALDESIDGPGALAAAVAMRAGSVLNLKPARVGGLVAAHALLGAAIDAGWDVFVGGMLETGVGRASALALAAQPALALPTDLGPSSRYFERDLTDAIEADADGRVVVPDGPGIGCTVDDEAVEAFAVERSTLRAPRPAAVLRTDGAGPVSSGDLHGEAAERGWVLDHHRGSAAAFHQRGLPEAVERAVWWFEVERPTVVLGSTQRAEVIDQARAEVLGVEVVRRRSGGGAVWLAPGHVTWIDVILPAGDPHWDDDVGLAAHWLGAAWVAALAELGLPGFEVHRGGWCDPRGRT